MSSASFSEVPLGQPSSELRDAPGVARRAFLGRSLTGMAVGAAVLTGNSSAEAATSSQIPISSLVYPFPKLFKSIQKHENDHVAFLKDALMAAARPKPTFKNLDQTSYASFLRLSQTFENTGVQAYLGAAPAIFSKDYLAAAGSIMTMEARHAGSINVGLGDPVSPNNASFDTPATASQVATAVSPFISSLNGGPPLTYSTVPSPANDILILNFALALEYLEAEFYNINVNYYQFGG